MLFIYTNNSNFVVFAIYLQRKPPWLPSTNSSRHSFQCEKYHWMKYYELTFLTIHSILRRSSSLLPSFVRPSFVSLNPTPNFPNFPSFSIQLVPNSHPYVRLDVEWTEVWGLKWCFLPTLRISIKIFNSISDLKYALNAIVLTLTGTNSHFALSLTA